VADGGTPTEEPGELAAAPPAEEAIPQTGFGALQSGGLGAVVLFLLIIVRRLRRALEPVKDRRRM
jgi:hypothetical protein